jgi:hypothetical protein
MDKSVRILSTMLFCFKQKHDIVSYVKWYTGVKLEDGISLFRSLFIEELKVGWCTQFASSVWTVINTGTKYWNSLGFRTISHQAQSPPPLWKMGDYVLPSIYLGKNLRKVWIYTMEAKSLFSSHPQWLFLLDSFGNLPLPFLLHP